MTIRELLTKHGITIKELASRFKIPLRTVENWSAGSRVPPDYLVPMMDEILSRKEQG